jgi:UDP-N-acetylglucosamine 2-epimerase
MDLVMGNSSSGLIEVPCFHIPTIDIGERQRGRIKAESVISVPMQKEAISDALNLAFSPSFRQSLPQFQNPYRKDDGIARTLSILKEIRLSELRYKGFCDYPFDPEQGACQ